MSSQVVRDRSSLPPPETAEVAPGVFGYIQPDGTWMLNNTGFVVGRDGVLAIDATSTEARTRALLDAIARVTSAPVHTLANTHDHGDHTYGNCVFGPQVTIVGHELTRRGVIDSGLGTQALFPDVEFGALEPRPPFVTFADRLDLHVDDLRVEAHFMGPAHTTNDVVYWIPDHRVLFTGDLVFNGGTPFALMGSIAGWLDALERLRGFDAAVLVPGHGPVCTPAVFDDVADYLRFVADLAADGVAAGRSPMAAAKDADLGRFAQLTDRERLVGNLHRAYSEVRGEECGTALELLPILMEMVEYNGGQMPRCLA